MSNADCATKLLAGRSFCHTNPSNFQIGSSASGDEEHITAYFSISHLDIDRVSLAPSGRAPVKMKFISSMPTFAPRWAAKLAALIQLDPPPITTKS
jgi:hypothetical protein